MIPPPERLSCGVGKGFGHWDPSAHLDVEHWLAFQEPLVLQRRGVDPQSWKWPRAPLDPEQSVLLFDAMAPSSLLKLVRGFYEPHEVSSCFQVVKSEFQGSLHFGPSWSQWV